MLLETCVSFSESRAAMLPLATPLTSRATTWRLPPRASSRSQSACSSRWMWRTPDVWPFLSSASAARPTTTAARSVGNLLCIPQPMLAQPVRRCPLLLQERQVLPNRSQLILRLVLHLQRDRPGEVRLAPARRRTSASPPCLRRADIGSVFSRRPHLLVHATSRTVAIFKRGSAICSAASPPAGSLTAVA